MADTSSSGSGEPLIGSISTSYGSGSISTRALKWTRRSIEGRWHMRISFRGYPIEELDAKRVSSPTSSSIPCSAASRESWDTRSTPEMSPSFGSHARTSSLSTPYSCRTMSYSGQIRCCAWSAPGSGSIPIRDPLASSPWDPM
jgi:hypothetical protein